MWMRFAPVLRCPLCSGPLAVHAIESSAAALSEDALEQGRRRGLAAEALARWVETGVLGCAGCGVDFPVFKGLPVLLPYETRLHGEFAAAHGAAAAAALQRPLRFASREPVPGERFVLSSFSTEWLAYRFDGVIWEMDYADHERRFLLELGPYRPKAPGGMFLEVGCGIGLTTAMAQKNFGLDAVGVDLSLAGLPATQRNRDNPFLHFVQASVFYLPFEPGTFETIYSRGVLHHTYSTEKAFAALSRFAREGGSAYLWVYGPKSIDDNLLRRTLFAAERAVRRLLRGRDQGWLAAALLWPLACCYLVFNHARRLADPTIQPYNFRRALHAARDRFTPEFAHRHSAEEVQGWFRGTGFADIEVVDWRVMPSADHDDYRRNTGVRGRRVAAAAG